MKFEPVIWEPEILDFWEKKKIYDKIKKKISKGKVYRFLDGPPYTTGKIHLGHAWNYSLKDTYRRYLRMRGFNVHDQPGFDTHGLPIENKVEKKLGIKNKHEIVEKIGVAKFVKECQDFAYENMHPMIKDFKRLGVSMDWEHPYMSLHQNYLEGSWWALKQAWKNGYLYKGLKSNTWCPRCATSLAKHELVYRHTRDNSIFVKFPIANKKDEYLLVWTTTPWTIPFNLFVMVNPKLEYVKAKTENETLIVANDLAEKVFGMMDKKYKIISKFKGSKLKDLKYKHPLVNHIPALRDLTKLKNAHKIILSEEFVSAKDGTGLVHGAPGCGPEDFEVGKKNNLPPFNELDEHGHYSEKMGEFAGYKAREDDEKFIGAFENLGIIALQQLYEHDYATCWRCNTDVIYKATDQWFLATSKLKKTMLKENTKINWNPDWAGNRQFKDWLTNLEDWNISRQRFWGIPLPIWICEICDETIVVESAQELKKLKANVPEDLHKPWIDEVKLKCRKCTGKMSRVPDVLDVWLDSGSAPWASTNEHTYVADIILEGKDQIRGWFNSLNSLSMVARKNASFKSVFMHGFINDSQGRKMSKSEGNVISPYEVFDKYGADAFRFYVLGASKPGLDLNYNFPDIEVKVSNLMVLWNTHKYLIESVKLAKVNVTKLKANKLRVEDKYMLSRSNSTVKKVTDLFEKHYFNEIPIEIENLFLELSRWYIKATRERDDSNIIYVMYQVLMDILKMLAPLTPFIAEKIYQNFRKEFGLTEESVHLLEWANVDEKIIDTKLENEIQLLQKLVSDILALREKVKRGLRWPIKDILIVTKSVKLKKAIASQKELVKDMTNVVNIITDIKLPEGVTRDIKPDYKKLAPKFKAETADAITKLHRSSHQKIFEQLDLEGFYTFKFQDTEYDLPKEDFIIEKKMPENMTALEGENYELFAYTDETAEMIASGFAREFTRAIQALRKKAGLQKQDKIPVVVFASTNVIGILQNYLPEILKKTSAKKLDFSDKHDIESKKHISEIKIRNETILIGL